MIRKEVLQMLENNAKLSADAIAAKLGLSVSDVAETIAEAEAKKIVLKYKAVIDWAKLNAEKIWAFIEVKAIPHGEKGFRDIAKSIDKFPQVNAVYLASGTYDMIILVSGESMHDIAVFVSEKLATMDTIQGTVTHFILKKYKEGGEIIPD
jgi:DNA-binding Lrp family transcriptional regulator